MDSQRLRQRRRRVALDQTQNAQNAQEEAVAGNKRANQEAGDRDRKTVARPYSDGARRSRQFKTTDLIPKRIWSVTAVVALLLSAIAGLNLLHLNSPNWISAIGSDGVAAFSLDSGRGIGVWYSNFLLLLTACVSLQLYLLRQHRRDDYRGSYRIWLWLAAIFLLASAASVTGISVVIRNLVTSALGSESASNAIVWVLAIKIVGLVLLVGRGLIEVRFSRLAVVGLLTVLLAYGTASLINEVPEAQSRASEVIHASLGNCLLIGCTALFLSVLGFARFVYLDANGLIKARDTSARSERREARVVAKAETRSQAKAEKAEAARLKQEALEEAETIAREEIEEAATTKEDARKAKEEAKLEKRKQREQARQQKRSERKSVAESDAEVAVQPATGKRKKKKSVQQETAQSQTTRKTARKNSADEPTVMTKRSGKRTTESSAGLTGKVQQIRKKKQQQQSANPESQTSVKPIGDEYLLSISDEDAEGLSKSDRRRLRKLKRRDERRAA